MLCKLNGFVGMINSLFVLSQLRLAELYYTMDKIDRSEKYITCKI